MAKQVSKFKTVSLQTELLDDLKWELDGFGFDSHAARVRFIVQQFLMSRKDKRDRVLPDTPKVSE